MEHSLFSLPPTSEARLQSCTSLPSPPKVALEIIQLVQDPDLEIDQVVKALSLAPALFIKILRMANSAHYTCRSKVDNMQKAIMVIGLNGVLSLALSFSLAHSLGRLQGQGLDYTWYWRRALIAGSICRALGEMCRRKDLEELFTAAFIQDMGMMAIDQVEPTVYADLDFHQVTHLRILAQERKSFGADHAVVGSWLLSQWNFPELSVRAVRLSDEPGQMSFEYENAQFFRCVCLAGALADLYLIQVSDEEYLRLCQQVEQHLGLGAPALLEILEAIGGLVSEKAALFEIDCKDGFEPEIILEKARDLLVNRNIRGSQPVEVLSSNMASIKSV